MLNAGLEDSQAGIKISRRNINNLKYADATTLIAENEKELKSLLMKVKEESEKAGLKLSIQNTEIMASGPIPSWQIKGKKVETVTNFIFLGSKITADGDCSHEIKRLLGRKAMASSVVHFPAPVGGGDSHLELSSLLLCPLELVWFCSGSFSSFNREQASRSLPGPLPQG